MTSMGCLTCGCACVTQIFVTVPSNKPCQPSLLLLSLSLHWSFCKEKYLKEKSEKLRQYIHRRELDKYID